MTIYSAKMRLPRLLLLRNPNSESSHSTRVVVVAGDTYLVLFCSGTEEGGTYTY